MKPTLKDNFAPALAILAQDCRVQAVYGFGSRVHGNAGPLSDVDIAVSLSAPIPLDEELRLRADVVTALHRDDVDLVILNDAPPLLVYEVVTRGVRLFARDALAMDEFEHRSIMEYFDTQYLRDVQRRLMREAMQ